MTEQEETDELESLAGGADKAFRLMRLWQTCSQAASGNRFTLRKTRSAASRFRERAAEKGYSKECIEFYITM
jgi:hypothetical protein